MIVNADSYAYLDTMEANSVDTVITDPPYGLKFMGKKWDYDIPRKDFWEKVLRVCKPGSIILVFGGTRTYHRLAVEIEDAGFEIRDCITWMQGQGFPKSYDFAWDLHKQALEYHGVLEVINEKETEQNTQYNMRFVQSTYLSQKVYACYECGQILQPFMSEQNIQEHKAAWFKTPIFWNKQSIMERRDNLQESERQLQRCEVCQMSHGIYADGKEGWVHHGTSISNGYPPWAIANEDGSYTSYRSQSSKQPDQQFDAILIECSAQAFRGYGTALKPAIEFICVGQKPLDGTYAENALKYGVAGLNIDGSRIGTEEIKTNAKKGMYGSGSAEKMREQGFRPYNIDNRDIPDSLHTGRFPANIILDEDSAALLDEQSGELKSGQINGVYASFKGNNDIYSKANKIKKLTIAPNSGGASRFFYVAKASRSERGTDNNHPTVKPIKLLEYLCTLTKTPTNGIILDPFMGSGSLGIAALNTGREYIGIEIDEGYYKIAQQRIQEHGTQNNT